MINRETTLTDLRGAILGEVNLSTSLEEQFQNKTLRPILKFQNDILVSFFIAYAIKNKNAFFSLSLNNKERYIEKAVQSDTVFRNQLIGIVIGLFTVEEYNEYIKNSSNLNKRILKMLIERWKSQVQILDYK
jgi:hypothetical protein